VVKLGWGGIAGERGALFIQLVGETLPTSGRETEKDLRKKPSFYVNKESLTVKKNFTDMHRSLTPSSKNQLLGRIHTTGFTKEKYSTRGKGNGKARERVPWGGGGCIGGR